MKYSYDLVIQIGSPPQFFGIKNLIRELSKTNKINFICFVPIVEDEHSRKMFDQAYELVKGAGFKLTRNAPDSCKVFLAAWPIGDTKYTYILRYTYSLLTAKPNPVYLPDSQRRYHGILTQNIFEFEILKVYANTYFVPNLKYIDWKKQKTDGMSVLFLPTWNADSMGETGKINTTEEIIPALKKLKGEGYRVIVKSHPLTSSNPRAKNDIERMKHISDEYIESSVGIQEVISRADVVISGNSGAIYEALYSNTPVIVYGNRTNVRHLGTIDTAHHRWIQKGIIENPNNAAELITAVNKSLKKDYLKKQQDLADVTFKRIYDPSAVQYWVDIIDKYLQDDINQDYIELHNIYSEYIDEKDRRIEKLSDEINSLHARLHQEKHFSKKIVTNSVLERLINKARVIKRRIRR